MKVKAKGKVIEVTEQRHKEKKYITRREIVVKDQDGDEPKFTFFGKDGVSLTEGITQGDDVEALGHCTSRVWQDKRYSDLNGVVIKVLSKAAPAAEREPGADDIDSGIPF